MTDTLNIRYKLDVATLLKHNSRETLLEIIPNELIKWETHEKTFAGKETNNG